MDRISLFNVRNGHITFVMTSHLSHYVCFHLSITPYEVSWKLRQEIPNMFSFGLMTDDLKSHSSLYFI